MCSASCSSSRARGDAPARAQGTRRPRARAAHHPSDLRPTRPPPRAGTQQDPQLLHDRVRARRCPGLPDTPDHDRRLPHRRARHLGASSWAAWRLRRALPPLAHAGRHLASVRALATAHPAPARSRRARCSNAEGGRVLDAVRALDPTRLASHAPVHHQSLASPHGPAKSALSHVFGHKRDRMCRFGRFRRSARHSSSGASLP